MVVSTKGSELTIKDSAHYAPFRRMFFRLRSVTSPSSTLQRSWRGYGIALSEMTQDLSQCSLAGICEKEVED